MVIRSSVKSVRQLTKDDFLFLMSKNNSEMLQELNRSEFGFIKFLENQRYLEMENEMQILEMVMEVLSRVCAANKQRNNPRLLRLFRTMKDCQPFLFDDIPRVINSCFSGNHAINIVLFITHYMEVLRAILQLDFFPCEKILSEIFPALENYMNRLREMKRKNKEIAEESFRKLNRTVECCEKPLQSDNDGEIEIKHFRDLPILPRSNDIVNYEIYNIPQNIIDRPYESVDHFLSVHYRLMREDMLRCFRECVKECIPSNRRETSDKNKNHCYKNVSVEYPPKYTIRGIYYFIKITVTEAVDWSKKQILIPGSLVFLTPNSFNTVLFATVAKSPLASSNKSKECRLKIRLEDELFVDTLEENIRYQMIEPAAFFECYKHILAGIKEFSESTFPLSDVITYLDFNETYPEYLDGMKYCIHDSDCNNALNDDDDDACSCTKFSPLKEDEWPLIEGLDNQQTEAFKTAITKKVAAIQGPPGTGKTYVGVKIVKTLLENNAPKPIVICCLTNHALDQFLEKMLQYTKKVVRVGSQSKNDALEPYYLDNLMYVIHNAEDYNNLNKMQQKSLDTVKRLASKLLTEPVVGDYDPQLSEIKRLCDEINTEFYSLLKCQKEFLDDSALNNIINSKYKDQLRNVSGSITKSLTSSILEWLGCSHSSNLYAKCHKKFSQFDKMKEIYPPEVPNIWHSTEKQRFELFYYWRRKCLEILKRQLLSDIEDYKSLMVRYRLESFDYGKAELLKGADIIGLTTTGACKYKNFVSYAEPRIFVVDEAAQILESHVIASLVPSVQHLILIGDHEQLRPLPANHELSEKYNLNVSMFERLFLNNAPSATLVTQHRMKPCIAELLVPEPYKNLESSEEVYLYEEIRGVKSSVFFFDHQELEDQNSSGTSSSNNFEARMIVSLAKYLTLQSYDFSEITILATYAAQVGLIHNYLKEENLEISVTTVDNYQGEENVIILLSFVRSNSSAIGFLKESNRVCVALSRAKKGMFCFGNFQLFADKSELWKDIVDKLREKNMIDSNISLTCCQHETVQTVRSSDDILTFINSGCLENCNFVLPCSHTCRRQCHFDDPKHMSYCCRQPCVKLIDENRVCPRLCFERCKRLKKNRVILPCGHTASRVDSICYVEIPKLLPCHHLVTVPCYLNTEHYKCEAAVPIDLDCGHIKSVQCHQRRGVGIVCSDIRPETGACGHIVNVPCNLHLDENELVAFCEKSCGKLLDCGHFCMRLCRFCFDTGIHGFCNEKCEMTLPCGHKCPNNGFCNSPCPPCNRKCLLLCTHDTRCINECLRPCVKCEEPCSRGCEHYRCSNMCWEECDVSPCNEPCSEKLLCGHQCIGLCGDSCPQLCRTCNSDSLKIDKTALYVELQCTHTIDVKDLDEHIDNCLIAFDWPNCPECGELITCSTRYKSQLAQAKRMCIDSWDTSSDVSEILYRVQSMYGKNFIVPAQFTDVHGRIEHILTREKPKSDSLFVLKNCVVSLEKLLRISRKMNDLSYDELIQGKFETLLLWICNHLKAASYQQLKELQECVDQLQTVVDSKI